MPAERSYSAADLEQAQALGNALGSKAQERIAVALANRGRAERALCVQTLREAADIAAADGGATDATEATTLRAAAMVLEQLPAALPSEIRRALLGLFARGTPHG
jgi:predicted PP-loop superfamily ATPase